MLRRSGGRVSALYYEDDSALWKSTGRTNKFTAEKVCREFQRETYLKPLCHWYGTFAGVIYSVGCAANVASGTK